MSATSPGWDRTQKCSTRALARAFLGHHMPQWLRRPNAFLDAGVMATTAYMEAL